MRATILLMVLLAGCGSDRSKLEVDPDTLQTDAGCDSTSFLISDEPLQHYFGGEPYMVGVQLCVRPTGSRDTLDLTSLSHPGGGSWGEHARSFASKVSFGRFRGPAGTLETGRGQLADLPGGFDANVTTLELDGQCGTSSCGTVNGVDCGGCGPGTVCQANQCVSPCSPGMCGVVIANGGSVDCGGCPSGESCLSHVCGIPCPRRCPKEWFCDTSVGQCTPL